MRRQRTLQGREAVHVSSGDISFVRNKQFAHVEVAAVTTIV
jgi:hypothetical protein